MKQFVLVVLAIVMITGLARAEVIDVNIKGVDDGVKTSRQRDYKEAVLFAKREAVERAGVKIKSMTTVKDMVVNSDYIESKAEAALMPGYQIMDIGYQSDGTYLVILIGKVKSGGANDANEIIRDEYFVAYDDGTVLDRRTGLMWAAKDNGKNISWSDAKRYCENYQGGGYTDWRLPTQSELEGVYDKNKKNRHDYHITKLIDITSCCPWASETRGSEAAYFHFDGNGSRRWGEQSISSSSRVVPVRRGK